MLQSTQLWKFSWPRWWRHWKCLTKKTSGHTSNKKPGCKISRMSSSHVIMYLTHLSHLLFNLPLCHNCSSNSEARYHHQWHAVYIRSHIRLKVDGNSRKYSWLQTFGSGSSETIWYLISNTITSCNTYFYPMKQDLKNFTRDMPCALCKLLQVPVVLSPSLSRCGQFWTLSSIQTKNYSRLIKINVQMTQTQNTWTDSQLFVLLMLRRSRTHALRSIH